MGNRDDNPVPDADSAEATDFENLRLGPPFAIAHECALVESACYATVECECGQAFRMNLTQPGVKACPKCKEHYTHVLLVCTVEDEELVAEALELVFEANGVELPEGEEENPDEHHAEVADPQDGEPE